MSKSKVIIGDIVLKSSNIEFRLKFYTKMTLIGGNSCSGKTMMYNAFRDLRAIRNDVVCLDYANEGDSILELVRKSRNKVIVVDNADVVLNNNIKFEMACNTKNQFILFGRDTFGLCLGTRQYAELIIRDRVGVLYYPFKRG